MEFLLQFLPALLVFGGLTIALHFGLRRHPRLRWVVAVPPALFALVVIAVLITG